MKTFPELLIKFDNPDIMLFIFSTCGITFLQIIKFGLNIFLIFFEVFILKKLGIVFIPFLDAFFAIFFAGSTPSKLLNPSSFNPCRKKPSLLATSKILSFFVWYFLTLFINFSLYPLTALDVPVTQKYFENNFEGFTVADSWINEHLLHLRILYYYLSI